MRMGLLTDWGYDGPIYGYPGSSLSFLDVMQIQDSWLRHQAGLRSTVSTSTSGFVERVILGGGGVEPIWWVDAEWYQLQDRIRAAELHRRLVNKLLVWVLVVLVLLLVVLSSG